MRVHTICLLVPALGIAMTGPIPILAQRVQAQGAAGNKMVLPANPAEEDIVPVELAREIAAFEAQTMFGPGALSQPMVGRDLNGCTRAYIFVVARGMAAFPTDSTIMARLRDARAATPAARQAVARAREAALSAQLDVEVEGTGGRGKIRRSADWDAAEDLLQEQLEGSWGTRDYGTVIVSGRKDLVPVLSCGTGLPPHFVWLDHAAQLARDSLGTPSVSLRCLWFAGPMDQILEFVSTSGEVAWVVLFPPSLARPGSVTPRLLESTDLERAWVREKWDAVMRALAERRPQPRTNHFIDDRIDVVPSYLWTAGCAPTSATMVLGYWDWDSPIGRRLGYGRLSPFSFERRAIINYSDDEGVPYHFDANATDPIGCLGIPYSVYALARGMHTEATHGGTWIGSGAHNIQDGIINWTNNESGYGFSSSESFTTWDYNPLWNTIRAEINADRPCEWSRNGNWQGGPSGTHAVAVFGYSDGGDVYYRNTWDLGVHWDQYQGNGQSMADVTTAVPGGGSGDNDVDLIAPDGGEAWGAGSVHAITWHQWGGTIDRAVIEYSYSSGYMWDAVGTSASVPGGNQYWWTVPCSISDDVFVRISAYDGATLVAREGSSERWSIAWPTVPDVPILLSPGDGETCESTTGSLDWSDVGGATGYMVQLWTTCGTGTEYPTTGSNYSYSGLQPNTTYYWRVKTRTSCDVWGSYSACFTFTTAPTLPGIPAPVAPADGSTCQGTAGTVTWVGVPGAAGYAYRVGEYCGGGSETETSATSGLYSGLQPGVTYHWQVKAKNSCDQWGPYCECFSFATTPSPPSAPTLISPENGASDQPLSGELDWGDASGAEAYAYQLDMSCGQGSEQVVPSSQASYSGLLPGATYFWRVKARDACGQWGSYTACRWFTTVGGSGGAAACCAGGSCALLTETECGAAQGAWHPEWSSCEPNPCADTTLVAYWPYDEGNGDTSRDGSGKGHVMHAVNGAGFTSNGFLGSAASLEGGDERWETPDAADLRGMSRLTIDAWVYPLGVVENKNLGVVTHWPNGRDCYFLVLQPDGRPWAAIRGSSRVDLVANQVLPLSRWSRLTIVYDGATLDLFVDGRLDASTAAPVGALNNYADPLYVGRNNFDAQSPGTFVGYIDEVRIHRAAVYPSPGPAGACCVAGLCTLTTEEECFSIEGVWHSEWASCEPNPCQQTERACCYGDTCVVTTESACADLSGIWRPDRAACLPTPCSEGGGDLSGGVFIAHAPPEMQYSDVAPPDGWCQEYFSRNPLWRAEDQVNRIDSMIPSRIWYVLAAWEGGRRWCATEFGLGDYEPGEFTLLGYGPCYQSGAQGIETSSSGWPGPREGTALVLTAGEWSGNYSPVYWFALYAYYEEVIPLAPNPAHSGGPFGGFVSCEDPLTAYPAVCFGALGLYTDGVACYPGVLAERACCSDGQCMLLSQSECGSISGVWHSEWTSCEPNPCPQPERGACCLPDSSCVWSSEGHCAQLSGVWHRYRECESYQCTAPLPCHGEVDTLENADGEWGGYISSNSCWGWGGIEGAEYGALAECYDRGPGEVCGVVLYLAGGGSPDPLASVYVWDDALDHPGSILAVRDSLPLELVEQWPEFGRYEVAIGPVPVEGRFWVGCRSVYQDVRDWYVAIDTDGGEGCRLLNFPPGYGFPTGWNDVGICWSSARALGIGALFSSAASGALEGTGVLPTRLALGLPTPNPSCGSVSVELDLPRRCAVRVQVFDVAGKLVQTLMAEDPPPGRHLLCWDGSSIGGLESPAGTYLIRLKAGNSTQVRKAMLIR